MHAHVSGPNKAIGALLQGAAFVPLICLARRTCPLDARYLSP